MDIKHYLKRLEILRIDPNFYVSEPYLRFSKVRCVQDEGWIWLEDEDWILFPPLPLPGANKLFRIIPIWSDFYNCGIYGDTEILDYEYLFNPEHFLNSNMQGGKWETFRKNIRKWPMKQPGWRYTQVLENGKELSTLLISWLEHKGDSVQDAEGIVQFVQSKRKDVHKSYLYDGKGRLAAVNIWDANYKYINYRLCITRRNDPYLEEFVRYRFYMDDDVLVRGKLVNDGGILDSPGLEKFKDKMNPIRKRIVYQTKL